MKMHLGNLLAIGSALASVADAYAVKTPPLDTIWTSQVGTNPWPQYPRPKLQRSQWQSLNGIWTYRSASGLDELKAPPFNQTFSADVLVPSCLESALSGVQATSAIYSWLKTSFSIPANWTSNEQLLLNFGAVDYEATVFVNGRNVAFNRGGYSAFSVDITSFLTKGQNELLVFVHDPTDSGDHVIPIGKQTLNPTHIFYTPCSGIWQGVWIESAPAGYITSLDIDGDKDGNLNVLVSTSGNSSASVSITVFEKGSANVAATGSGNANAPITFTVPSPKLWSPESPNLYDVAIKLGNDSVSSYTGFRSISRGAVNSVQRILLNGQVVLPFGTLDQGYWPDGIYTPPTYEAMVFDLQTLKKLGMNMVRKHIKVEPDLFYQACDQLGLLVIQDMPALRPSQSRTLANCTTETILPNADQQAEFQRQLEVMINQHKSYTSIFTWVIYNEGWGQITTAPYPEYDLTSLVRRLDPTRLIDATSGWFDHGAGDYSDNHHYSSAQCGTPFHSRLSSPFDPRRIGFQGEFGGLGNNVSIENLWNVPEALATIDETYELDDTIAVWNYRAHMLLEELRAQIELFSCSGAVWTQTTDVEGEVNGLLTYDRRILRADVAQWKADVQALYAAVAKRSNSSSSSPPPVASQQQQQQQSPVTTSSAVTLNSAGAGQTSDAQLTSPWPAQYWATYVWTPEAVPRTTSRQVALF